MSEYSNPPSAGNRSAERSANDSSHSLLRVLSDRLLDALQVSLIFFDAEGVILRTNRQARKDLKMHRKPTGRRISDMIAIEHVRGDILPELMARFDSPLTDRVPLPPDVFLQNRDHRVRFFVKGCITRLDSGLFLFTFRNIVEQLTREYMSKMALNSTLIFPWYYDMDKAKMAIDSSYFDYTQIPAGDCTMSVEAFTQRLHPDDRQRMIDAFGQQIDGKRYPAPVPFRLLRGDGRYEWFEGQSTYLWQVEGLPYRVVGVCMSTQTHKDIEEALTAARDKAQESDRQKTAFMAEMSHELRTPLNAIVGFTSLLTSGDTVAGSDEAKEYADLIVRNCEHLLTMMSDMLDLSQIARDTMEYRFGMHSLRELLTLTYDRNRYAMPEGVVCNLSVPSGRDDVLIETDPRRLYQVLDHLIANSVKFTRKGHIDLGYTLSEEGESVAIFVADTGCGIPEDLCEKIFERFYKVDPFVQGAGLGLSICKTVAERLGGTLGVVSQPNEGARFTLRLPLRRRNSDCGG